MIAAVAWRQQATLLARDADLAHVALVAGIELDESSQQR
jgi:predicted nucleic acid-binding protein